MIKLCIFDFDGTLFNSIEDFIVYCNKALQYHDFPVLTKEDYVPCLGGDIDDFISKVLGENSTPQNIEKLKETYLDLYNSSKKEFTCPFVNAHECLKKLQENGILLAINSNRFTYFIMELTERFFSDIDFVLIEGLDIDSPSKPDPFGVNKIINEANVSLDETLYIGDAIEDIQTAKNSGIDCIIVKWGYGNKETFKEEYPLEFVSDFAQLYDIICDK